MATMTMPNGDKVQQVTHHKPQVWTHKGYKCYMYQSSNEYLSWRLHRILDPSGTEITDPNRIRTTRNYRTPDNRLQAYNISTSRKGAQSWLRAQIEWDMLPEMEKARIINLRESEDFDLLF